MNDGNRPKFPANKPHSIRVQVLFTEDQIAIIDEWAIKLGLSNRNEAIRALIMRGTK